MPGRAVKLTYGIVLTFGMASLAPAQDDAMQRPSARQELQRVHTPQSIDWKRRCSNASIRVKKTCDRLRLRHPPSRNGPSPIDDRPRSHLPG
jgi:hypothetical protein